MKSAEHKVARASKWARINWVNVFWLTGTPLGAMTLTPLYLYFFGVSWALVALLLVSWAMTNLSVTAGYHRLIAHRSYDASPGLRLFYLLIGAASFQGSALQWAADHRRHHRLVDSDEDPYSINKGLFYAHMGWLFYKEDPRHLANYPLDLTRDPLIAWQHKYYIPLAFLMGFGVPTLVGAAFGNALGGLLFGGLLRVVISQHCTFFINSLCHYVGKQPYNLNNTARDSVIMAILAFGEGYHNFHHRFQIDYRNGFRWYHWDPTKWIIQVTALLGWATKLRSVPDAEILKARMQIDHQRLLNFGAPPERLQALKTKVEEAQGRLRLVLEDYRELKNSMQSKSRARVLHLKAELRVSKLEFKMACRQWYVYMKTMKGLRRAYATGANAA